MIPVHQDPHFTLRFADDRIIPRFHLEGIEAGRRVNVFKIDPATGERLGLLETATLNEGDWGEPTGVDHPLGCANAWPGWVRDGACIREQEMYNQIAR